MTQETRAARTPGAKRAGPGECLFELAKIDPILGGPDYSQAIGPCVEGDRMMFAVMRIPAGTGAEPHSHPNEQWMYIMEGNFTVTIEGTTVKARPGSVVYIPANLVHETRADPDGDVVFATVKDAVASLHGIKAA
jgi:quercetin dioxygenase-like cupin family protein